MVASEISPHYWDLRDHSIKFSGPGDFQDLSYLSILWYFSLGIKLNPWEVVNSTQHLEVSDLRKKLQPNGRI